MLGTVCGICAPSKGVKGVATCVVVASSDDVRRVIAASLEDLGLDVRAVSALGELPVIVKEVAVGGILLELATSIQSSPEEKEEAHEITRLYAFARFRLLGDEVRILGAGNSLEAFAERCRQSRPRVTRREARERRHLGVYVSGDPGFEDAEKTVTIDISKGGCFVYSSREWRVGDSVWLRFPGEEADFSGTVRFWREWGNDREIPGIGIRFREP